MAAKKRSRAAGRGTTPRTGGRGKLPPGCPQPKVRIAEIVKLMASGEWYGARTRVALGEKWGITEPTVRKDAAAAHIIIGLDVAELEQDRLALALYCAKLREAAATDRDRKTGQLDISGAVKAAETEAKFRGINVEPPKRVDLKVDATGGLAGLFERLEKSEVADVAPESGSSS